MRILSFFFILCFGLGAFAQDVISATSEDLKEFDRMLAKKKPDAPPVGAAKDTAGPRKNEDPRQRFNDGPARRGEAGGPPGQGPRPPTEPGANPGPGAVAPPPPPPPPRDGGGPPPR